MNDIDSFLSSVENITFDIETLLGDYNKVDDIDSEMLLNLYNERKKYIDFLKVIYNNSDGRDFINKNSNLNWDSRIKSILETDKNQLDRIQDIIVEVSGKIKNIVKQKSLLIYSK